MGQADRRGTFQERKAKAVIRKKEMVKATLAELESPDPESSEKERKEQAQAKLFMMSFAAFINRSGLSAKEAKRRLKRYHKKK